MRIIIKTENRKKNVTMIEEFYYSLVTFKDMELEILGQKGESYTFQFADTAEAKKGAELFYGAMKKDETLVMKTENIFYITEIIKQ